MFLRLLVEKRVTNAGIVGSLIVLKPYQTTFPHAIGWVGGYYGDFIIFFLHASKCKQQSEIFHYFLLHGAAVARNEKLISCLVIQRNVCGKKFFPNRRKYSFPTLLRTVGNSIFSPILQTFLYCFCCCAALSFFALVCLEKYCCQLTWQCCCLQRHTESAQQYVARAQHQICKQNGKLKLSACKHLS